jgi:hypothetical protein
MSDEDDRFAAWTATEEQTERAPGEPDSSGSGFAPKKERRSAAIVCWRRNLLSLTGRRGVLERKGDEDTATLTSNRGEVLFTAPIGEVRCRRSWPYCFTIECDGKRWRMWGIGVNNRKLALRQLEIAKRDNVFTLLPMPPGMSEQRYLQIMKNKMAQQKLWRELWLIALKTFGAQQI